MNKRQLELLEKVGLSKENFEANNTTIEDLTELINTLVSIVIMED